MGETSVGGLFAIDNIHETPVMTGDVLGNTAGSADLALGVANGEEGVADPAHAPVLPDDAKLLSADFAQFDALKRASRALPIIRMEEAAPTAGIAEHSLPQLAPNGFESGAQVFEVHRLEVQDPKCVAGVLGELPEALLALTQGCFGPLALRDVQSGSNERNGTAMLESGPALGGNPALDPILDPDHAVFDGVDPKTGRIATLGDSGLDARAILGMNAGQKHLLVDMSIRGQPPHRLEPGIPVQCSRDRIPGVWRQPDEVDGGKEPRLGLVQGLGVLLQFGPVRFGLVEGRGHLERGRGEAGEALQDARILCIEPSLGCVPDGPEGADRLAFHMPGGEQVLVDAWLDTPEGRKEPLRLLEQKDAVAFHYRPTGARLPGHDAMKVRCKLACCGVPAEQAACSAGLQDAHAGGIRMAQLYDQFSTILEHGAWIGGHLLGHKPERSALGFVA